MNAASEAEPHRAGYVTFAIITLASQSVLSRSIVELMVSYVARISTGHQKCAAVSAPLISSLNLLPSGPATLHDDRLHQCGDGSCALRLLSVAAIGWYIRHWICPTSWPTNWMLPRAAIARSVAAFIADWASSTRRGPKIGAIANKAQSNAAEAISENLIKSISSNP